jgi:hypothetical protein
MGEAHQGTRFKCAIQLRFAAARDSIELVLGTSKQSIPESIEILRIHEKIMRNYVDLYECTTVSPRGSNEIPPNFPGDWLKFMMKTCLEQRFPNTATASNAIETARILLRSRQGVKLVQSVVWDQIRSAYLSTGGLEARIIQRP